jgi:uncharacterized delta-60 repeat protein
MKMSRKNRVVQRAAIESLEIRQLLSGGVLDTSFNNGHGLDSISFGKTGATANGMAVQSDGKIVEVGTTSTGQYVLLRLTTDGQLDTTFGPKQTGEVTGNIIPGHDDVFNAVAIQSDGKIVVAGADYPSLGDFRGNFIVMRFLANGTIDKSFGIFGLESFTNVLSSSGADEDAAAIAIQKDGKIIWAGSELQGFGNKNFNMIMDRLNINGTLDTSFGDGGETNLDLGKSEFARGLAIDYNGSSSTNSDYGKIVLVGNQAEEISASETQSDMVIARYNSNGKLDTSFAGDGHEVTTIGIGDKAIDAHAAVIESGGKIVIAGSEGSNTGSADHDFFLTRFNSNGNPDLTFGTNAVTTTNFGGDDYATSLIIGSLGQQLIAGGTSGSKFALAAYSLNGKPFGEFGTNGMVTTKGDRGVSNVTIALAPGNKIVAVGGTNFNTARYSDITLGVSVTSTDDAAGEGKTIKHVGKLIEFVPNTANLIVSRDQALPTATRVFFTISGTANMPNKANIKLKRNDYTLSGMTIPMPPANNTTGYVDIPAGQTSVTVTMTAVDDSIPEPTELAKFAIASSSAYVIGSPSSETLSILDNDSTTLTPTADAYVQDGNNAGNNFGTMTALVVKKSGTTGDNRQAYLMFDLSSLTMTDTVKLNLFGALNVTGQNNIVTQLFSVANNSWTETGITFNNAPAASASPIASATILDTTQRTYTFDVTAYVKAQLALGNKTVSFVLKNPSNSGPAFIFNSREAGSNKPALTVT